MDKITKKFKGEEGERIARDYLESLGYRILATNYRLKVGEIDLVVIKKGILVFAEVKSIRGAEDVFSAEEKVNLRKQRRIVQVSEFFCSRNRDLMEKIKQIRYDVLVVDLIEKRVVRHYESAFFAED